VMAVGYLLLALWVLAINITRIPALLELIFRSAFSLDAGLGGLFGSTIMMGIKRGLFSNEAGEGSTPNVAATASVSHPVKQGLIQTLGVFTDTLVICSATALIILLGSGDSAGLSGIALTQSALDSEVGRGAGSIFISIAIFFFAFTSIVANYYYGETNIKFFTSDRRIIIGYRICVAAMVFVGACSTLDFVWAFADITMGLMTLCNLIAIMVLGRYAVILLGDYRTQLRSGRDPVYHSSTIPSISSRTTAWP
ncbi:MAG: alanine:cation symporter family protein, partial [Duncaniella sp.]|nr:alanine:cation symporter family protein [Duncaniella sp.]